MSRSRMLLVSTVLCFIIAGHLFDAWRQRDHWPFAAYPMFARVNKPEPFTSEELWGVTGDGQEIPITSRMTGVMGTGRVRPALMRLYLIGQRSDRAGPELAENALAGLLNDYERRRALREHDGPPLLGMKFYQLRWEFDWWAKNRDTPARSVLIETGRSTTTRPATDRAVTETAVAS